MVSSRIETERGGGGDSNWKLSFAGRVERGRSVEQKVRDEKEEWESGTKRSEVAGIYTSGSADGRTQSGETGCAEGALPEAVTIWKTMIPSEINI